MPRLLARAAIMTTFVCAAACRPPVAPAAVPAAPAVPAAVRTPSITVTYRDGANVFEILDNVSSWWPDKCDAEYRTYWKERFGITAADDERFATYKKIRKAHYPRPQENDGESAPPLFGIAKPLDRFAEAFYGAATVDEGLSRLADVVDREELATLRAIFAVYRPSYEVLLAESAPYRELASALQRRLDDAHASATFLELTRFYGVDATSVPDFDVLYVWWPPAEHIAANNRGRHLLLKYNPTTHLKKAARDSDLPVHELIHYVSSHQPEEQKRTFAKAFREACRPRPEIAPVDVLEEPMAVAQQKLFLSVVAPEKLEFASPWYGDPWVSDFAKDIYPQVKEARSRRRPLDADLMRALGRACASRLARTGQ